MRPVSVKLATGALKNCSSYREVQAVHALLCDKGIGLNVFVANCLIDMYTKLGSLVDAVAVFDRMPQHSPVSWSCIITRHAQNGQGQRALELYERMRCSGVQPSVATLVAALRACASLAGQEACSKQELLQRGLALRVDAGDTTRGIFVGSALVEMYVKCADVQNGRVVFDKMPQHGVVALTSMIMGYVRNGEAWLGWRLYEEASEAGDEFFPDAMVLVAVLSALAKCEPRTESLVRGKLVLRRIAGPGDVFVASALVGLYARCGSMADAYAAFCKMPQHSVVSWNCAIMGYAENGEAERALDLYACMLDAGLKPDLVTFLAAVKACAALGGNGLQRSKAIHTQAAEHGFAYNSSLANSLVDMYAKCGSMVDALLVFQGMQQKSVVAWNCVIMGYAENGEGGQALSMFEDMRAQGSSPDHVTYVAALKACASFAALELGRQIESEIMQGGFQAQPAVANSLVDFYGKCGCMAKASQLAESIPVKDLTTWNALMSGYSRQGDAQAVFRVFNRMESSGTKPDGITFSSLLSVCSHAGLVDQGQRYFHVMWSKYEVEPEVEHHVCMVDMLGRANRLTEALEVAQHSSSSVLWMSLLAACRKWKNLEVGELCFHRLLELDRSSPAPYVLMSHIYARLGMHQQAASIQASRRAAGAWKPPGQSWWTNAASGDVHVFVGSS